MEKNEKSPKLNLEQTSEKTIFYMNSNYSLLYSLFEEHRNIHIEKMTDKLLRIIESRNQSVKNQEYAKAADLRDEEFNLEKLIIEGISNSIKVSDDLQVSNFINEWLSNKNYDALELIIKHPEILKSIEKENDSKSSFPILTGDGLYKVSNFKTMFNKNVIHLLFDNFNDFLLLIGLILDDDSILKFSKLLLKNSKKENVLDKSDNNILQKNRRLLLFNIMNWVASLDISKLNFSKLKK